MSSGPLDIQHQTAVNIEQYGLSYTNKKPSWRYRISTKLYSSEVVGAEQIVSGAKIFLIRNTKQNSHKRILSALSPEVIHLSGIIENPKKAKKYQMIPLKEEVDIMIALLLQGRSVGILAFDVHGKPRFDNQLQKVQEGYSRINGQDAPFFQAEIQGRKVTFRKIMRKT